MKLTPTFIDFETYWDTEHTLSKMNPIDYVMHEKTQLISLSYKFGSDRAHCIFGEAAIRAWVEQVRWWDKYVIAHNNEGFDSMVAAWRLGIRPAMWGCTMAMARPIHAKTTGLSLAKLVEHYGIGVKDNSILLNTRGKRLEDFTATELAEMRRYNTADTDQCAELFRRLLPHYSQNELKLIDATIRMLVEPKFQVDKGMLDIELAAEKSRKKASLEVLAASLGVDTTEQVMDLLGSGPKFAAFLESRGVEVPMKPSPANPEKQTYALAKTDEDFLILQEHNDDLVSAAVRTRLGVKSTILETRIEQFLAAADATGGLLPIPLKYCGADTTGRWSGWAYNPQNLPRVGKDPKPSDALRMCLTAGKGAKIVVADLSGIELRINLMLWKTPYAMALYAADPEADLYKPLASEVLGVPMEDMPKMVRQAGKAMHLGCFASETRVLTHTGIKRIVDVLATDRVWDGVSWVHHNGIVHQGVKETIAFKGVRATRDHKVLTQLGWKTWEEVCENRHLFQSAIHTGNLPSWRGSAERTQKNLGTTHGLGVRADGKDSSTGTTLRNERQLGAIRAQSKQPRSGLKSIGSTRKWFQTTRTVRDYLIDFRRLLVGATEILTNLGTINFAVLLCSPRGGKTAPNFYGTLLRSPDGTSLSSTWTESTTTKGMSRGTFGSLVGKTTATIDVLLRTCREKLTRSNEKSQVYDLLNCGPHSRFTVVTDEGPVLVHNCGFGLGSAKKYRAVAKSMAGIDVTEEEGSTHILGYRKKHVEVVAGWKTCHAALPFIFNGQEADIDPWGMCHTTKEGIKTPKGMIRYPDLRQEATVETTPEGKKVKWEWVYGQGRNKTRIYAGKIDENIVQHLAWQVIADDMIEVKKLTGWWPALTVHDELVYVVPESEAEELLNTVQTVMRTPPVWWPELVTWSEGGIADRYGEAK